jgi:hypothetical protein
LCIAAPHSGSSFCPTHDASGFEGKGAVSHPSGARSCMFIEQFPEATGRRVYASGFALELGVLRRETAPWFLPIARYRVSTVLKSQGVERRCITEVLSLPPQGNFSLNTRAVPRGVRVPDHVNVVLLWRQCVSSKDRPTDTSSPRD